MVENQDLGPITVEVMHLLGEAKPQNLLLVGPDAKDLAVGYLDQNPQCKTEEIVAGDYLDQLAGLGMFSAAIVAGVVECLEKHQAEMVLSRIRDLHAKRFWLLVPIGLERSNHASVWNQNDLIAFGMVRLSTYPDQKGEWHLYQYDLMTYKTTPEWYNSRYWANPQMWDKKWW